MGFVDDDSDSETEGNTLKSQSDAEANLANCKESLFHNHRISSLNDSRTHTTKNNDLLSITRLRRKGMTESEEIWEELEDDTLAELSSFSRRRSSVRSIPSSKPPSQEDAMDHSPNESTALLARSGTGRSYRDRRRRRSAPILETQERRRRRRSASSQEALGGWWRLKYWWRGREWKDKGKGKGTINGNSNGSGDSV